MNFALWTVTFHWQGIAWSDYSKCFWRLFLLGLRGCGSDCSSSAAAALSVPAWKLHLLSCWPGAGPLGGSQGCCDAARAALSPPTAGKGVGSWRTWIPLAHKVQRSSFCIDRNVVSRIWGGCFVSHLVQHFCVLWQRQEICSTGWWNITVCPGWQSKIWFLLALRRGEQMNKSF